MYGPPWYYGPEEYFEMVDEECIPLTPEEEEELPPDDLD